MRSLVTDDLIEAARKQSGKDRFYDETFREGLDILLTDINADADRPEAFVDLNRGMIVKALVDHLNVTAALSERPDVLDQPVSRPVFVFGIPRTGTTLLSNLLAADPARRSLLKWELDDPVPPPTTATLYNDPRALSALDAEREMLRAYPEAGRLYRMSAVYPFECVSIFAHQFRTLMWESAGKLPNYREFMLSANMDSAYDYHKRFLQLHQADAPGIYNLKMPSHGLFLDALLKTYPDARLIWTHRDPFCATASFCSILASGHKNYAGYVDAKWIGEDCKLQAFAHADRIMDARDRLGEERIVDCYYSELMTNPIETMRGLYALLGDDFTPEAEAAMQAWLKDNPQGKFGKHEYDLERYGLSVATLAPGFERYTERYKIAAE